jgi:hypothetical protein
VKLADVRPNKSERCVPEPRRWQGVEPYDLGHWRRTWAPRTTESQHETDIDRAAGLAAGAEHVEPGRAGHQRAPDGRLPPDVGSGRYLIRDTTPPLSGMELILRC